MSKKLNLKSLEKYLFASVLYLSLSVSLSAVKTPPTYFTKFLNSQKSEISQHVSTYKTDAVSIAQTPNYEMASIPKMSRWPIKRSGRNKRFGNSIYDDYGYNNCDSFINYYGRNSCGGRPYYNRPYGIPGLQSQYGILNSLLNEQLNKLSPGHSTTNVLNAYPGTYVDLKEIELIREKLRLKDQINIFGRIPYGNEVYHYHGPRYQHKRPPYRHQRPHGPHRPHKPKHANHNHLHHGHNQPYLRGKGWSSKGDDDSSEEDDSEEQTQRDHIKEEQRKTAQLQLLNTLMIQATRTTVTTTTAKPTSKPTSASVIICIINSATGSGSGSVCSGGGNKTIG